MNKSDVILHLKYSRALVGSRARTTDLAVPTRLVIKSEYCVKRTILVFRDFLFLICLFLTCTVSVLSSDDVTGSPSPFTTTSPTTFLLS